MRAGARGGARGGKPRWRKILMITAGSSIAARSVKGPPHCGQVVMSMAKIRLSNWAQLLRARVEAAGASPSSLEEAVAGSASPGTIWERRAALGASTPWKRMRWSRGRGTSAARRCKNSSGVMTRWVVPSRYGVLSCNTISPALVRIQKIQHHKGPVTSSHKCADGCPFVGEKRGHSPFLSHVPPEFPS